MVIMYSRGYMVRIIIMASEAQKKANARYKEKTKGEIVEMRYRVTPEERDQIKKYCDENNTNVSDFTRDLVFKVIGINR